MFVLQGPFIVPIDSDSEYFAFYADGVYRPDPSWYNCNKPQPTHAVLAVGYGSYQGIDYVIVKNSW